MRSQRDKQLNAAASRVITPQGARDKTGYRQLIKKLMAGDEASQTG
jgi:hypothetical protein